MDLWQWFGGAGKEGAGREEKESTAQQQVTLML